MSYLSTALVRVGATNYEPVAVNITQDGAWSPYWQGTVTFALGSAPAIDPTAYTRVRVKYWAGDLAANPNQPPLMDCLVVARAVATDHIAGTITVSVSSFEVLLQDLLNASTADTALGAMTLTAMLNYACTKIGVAVGGVPLPAVTIPATATVWRAGQSLDDWLRGPLRANGYDIFQDMRTADTAGSTVTIGAWLVADTTPDGSMNAYASFDPPYAGWGRVVFGVNMLECRLGMDLDQPGGWADSAVVTYSWLTSTGTQQVKNYANAPAGYKRPLSLNFQTPDPGFDPTPGMVSTAKRKIQTGQLTTVAWPSWDSRIPGQLPIRNTPGDFITITTPDGAVQAATVTRVNWSYPEDRTQLGVAYVVPTPLGEYSTPLP